MLSFLVSVAIACFFDVSGIEGVVQRIIYACTWLFVISLILWAVLTGWERSTGDNWRKLIPIFSLWQKIKDREVEEEEMSETSSRISTSTSRTWKGRLQKTLARRRFSLGKSSRSSSNSILDGNIR